VLYTAFYEASQKGKPIVRPLWYDGLGECDHCFMIGDSILVLVPYPEIGFVEYISADEYTWNQPELPKTGTWFPINKYAFARAGKVIPRLVTQQLSILNAINDPIDIEIYLDDSKRATGQMYVDEWDGFETGSLLKFAFDSETLWVQCGETDVILQVNQVTITT
jgi:alpha-glucosidase (family GH31 glycosyl hydrolase)